MKTIRKKIEQLLKLLEAQKKYGLSSLNWEAFQDNRIEHFFSHLLINVEFADDKKSFEEAIEAFNPFKDDIQIYFKRDSLWEKITRSKRKPRIHYLKDKKLIFEKLLFDNVAFRKCISSELDSAFNKAKNDLINAYHRSEEYRIRNEKKENKRLSLYDDIYDEEGDFKIDYLALVHVTGYKPKQDQNGHYFLESAATATDLEIPRNTLHFTIGHHVSAHLSGGWGELPYVLIIPMKKMIEANGTPMGISCEDTFFEVGLNENLILPEGTHLLEPAEAYHYKTWDGKEQTTVHNCYLKSGVLSATVGNRTFYKTNFTDGEKEELRCLPICFREISDDRLCEANKKQQLSFLLGRLGYVDLSKEQTHDSSVAEKIANMGGKIGVRSIQGQTLHSVHAVSGVNRLGEGVNRVIGTVKQLEKMLAGEDIETEKDYLISELREMENLEKYLQKHAGFLGQGKMSVKEEQVFCAWKKKSLKKIKTLLSVLAKNEQCKTFSQVINRRKKCR